MRLRLHLYTADRPIVTASSVLSLLALGAFALGTSELGVVGLLPAIARDTGLSAGTVGTLISVYAATLALAGPVLAAALAAVPRRTLLVGSLTVMTVGNGASAAAPDFTTLLVARGIIGAAAALYVVAALALATALVGTERRGRAVATVFGGVTVASVAGVPLATWMGGAVGWRITFAALALLSATVAALSLCLPLPAVPGVEPGLHSRAGALVRPGLPAVFSFNAMVAAGSYAASSYLVVLLTGPADLSTGTVGLLLITSGAATVVGNLLAGAAADRDVRRTVTWTATSVAVCLCTIPAAVTSPLLLWLVVVVWAGAFSGFSTAAQIDVARRAGPDGDLLAAANISVFNLGIAVGATAGGALLRGTGFTILHLSAAGLVAAALAVRAIASRD